MSRRIENPGRTGGYGNRRGFYQSWAVKGSGGPANPSPPHYAAANRSFKNDGNGHAQQWGAYPASLNSERNVNVAVQAGSQSPTPSSGSSDGLAPKPPVPRNATTITKSPSSSSQTSARAPHTSVQKLPLEASEFGVSGVASPPCLLQFGSFTAAIVNPLPVQRDTSRAVPMLPVPASPKQQQQLQQLRKDAQVVLPSSSIAVASRSSVLPIDATPRPIPSQQAQIPLPFGGPSPQVQSQGVAMSATKKTPTLPDGNARRDMPKPNPVQEFGQYCSPSPQMHAYPVRTQRFAPHLGDHQLSKTFTEPFDKNSGSALFRQSSEVPPPNLTQREHGTSMSSPVSTFGECGSIMTGVDGRDRDPVRTSESLKMYQEKACNGDVGHSQSFKDCKAPSITSLTTSIPILSISSSDNVASDGSANKQKGSEMTDNSEHKFTELPDGDTLPVLLSEPTLKSSTEPTRQKNKQRKKKKRNNAHKDMEQKKEIASTSERMDSSFIVDHEEIPADVPCKESVASEREENKGELDNWDDSADISTTELNTSENSDSADISTTELNTSENSENKHSTHDQKKLDDEFGKEVSKKNKYTRDFLLTFAEKHTELPKGFEIGSDVTEAFMRAPGDASRGPYPNYGRNTDRPSQPLRGDHRISATTDDGKWNKLPGTSGSGVDGPASFRPNLGVLRNPHGRPSHQFAGGIFTGPIRGNADTDRWQRATAFQRGLISPPQTPLQVMHKAEKKYKVGMVADMAEAKQRQLKAILNKLTPQNFEKLFAQVIDVNIDTVMTLKGVISQIFDKALMEPTFCEMYADFCFHLAEALPDFTENNEKITFKRLLINKCQEEFEKGEKEQAEAVKVEHGEIKQSEEQREERRLRARRRMLGNIRLIGELYKKKMITEKIMHHCINKLIGEQQDPDEEDIEALCKLMATIGETFDHEKAREHMDAYFRIMQNLSTRQKLSSRVRFMLKDAIDLRKNKWQQRRKVEGPKKIEQVHRDAVLERQAQTSRLLRGPVTGSTMRRGPPTIDYAPRGSTEPPSSSRYIGSTQILPPQARGHAQDVRLVDNQFESRTLSVPLPQQSTFAPEGALSKEASTRGQPLISIVTSEIHSRSSDVLRTPSGSNDHSSKPCLAATSALLFSSRPNTPEAEPLSEGALREKSISAIREFYSAKDEKEIALCVKELNAPSFYPSMVSLWVMDSFERKDLERELLSKLLVNLFKSDSFTRIQLIKGFESVLSLLEDAVNDAPRAGEFLGRIFATVILDNVISLREIGALLHQGGEEPGRLLEVGLAAEVLGSILEAIRTEKGDTLLNEIRLNSEIRLEDFKMPNSMRSKLDAFL